MRGRDRGRGVEVREAAGGCELARERLVREFLPVVRVWAVRLVASEDVDDLVQATMVAMLAGLGRWSGGEWRAYVRAIAWRLSGAFRARRALGVFDNVEQLEAPPDPLEQLQELKLAQVWLDALPDWQQQAIALGRGDGLQLPHRAKPARSRARIDAPREGDGSAAASGRKKGHCWLAVALR